MVPPLSGLITQPTINGMCSDNKKGEMGNQFVFYPSPRNFVRFLIFILLPDPYLMLKSKTEYPIPNPI